MGLQKNIDATQPLQLHLKSALLALEPTGYLISLAKKCGGGVITEDIQRLLWNYCNTNFSASDFSNASLIRKLSKSLIHEVESSGGVVLDEIYELCSSLMASPLVRKLHFIPLSDLTCNFQDSSTIKSERVLKRYSFLFPETTSNSSKSDSTLIIPLICSTNMLEGDTGCSVWPASLYLSEFIFSYPKLFENKSCFEIGSGAGLVGICLSHVGASKVTLSDGDVSSLQNLKHNIDLNSANIQESSTNYEVIHLPWDSASKSLLSRYFPDILLGADVIYDPACLPDLVRVIAWLLCNDSPESLSEKRRPVAYVAAVVRNEETFNYFLRSSNEGNLDVADVTANFTVFSFLPYLQSYSRDIVRLLEIKCI